MGSTGTISFSDRMKALAKWADLKMNPRPKHVNLEVTKKCNARCTFCFYWQTKDETVLDSYAAIVRKFDPIIVTISGGEPTLRQDLPQLVRGMKDAVDFVYISMVNNGSLLTKEKAKELHAAGLNQINFSLDFPDERHDVYRGMKGNFDRIVGLVRDIQDIGFDRINFNTFIMRDNLHDVVDIAKLAYDLRIGASYSCYSSLKTDKDEYMIPPDEITDVHRVVNELVNLKHKYGHIRNSDYYLLNIPDYFVRGAKDGCRAGKDWVHVTAEGYIQPCSELPIKAHYTEFTESTITENDICDKCWFACRGESQAPLNLARIGEVVRKPAYELPFESSLDLA
ncbi:MAG: radical SAM protein [Deltaproteobacteria bacterium]|nr:radical SAM protein [Deltaproteobacteria bacterium]